MILRNIISETTEGINLTTETTMFFAKKTKQQLERNRKIFIFKIICI